MKTDILTQYISAHKALLNEKTQLEARLQQITQVLTGAPAALTVAPKPTARVFQQTEKPLSLKAAVLKATTGHPLTKLEILAAIQKLGYRTTSKHPLGLLDNLLYGKNPKFKNDNGKFSPLSTTKRVEPARKAAQGVTKSTLSAAGRARLSALAKARWAAVKKAGGKRLKRV